MLEITAIIICLNHSSNLFVVKCYLDAANVCELLPSTPAEPFHILEYAFFQQQKKKQGWPFCLNCHALFFMLHHLPWPLWSGMYPIICFFHVLSIVEDNSPAHSGPIGRLFLKEKAVRLEIIIQSDLLYAHEPAL